MSEGPYLSEAELAACSIESLEEYIARVFWVEELEDVLRGPLPHRDSRGPWQVDILYREYRRTRREARRARNNRDRATIKTSEFGSYYHDLRRLRVQGTVSPETFCRTRANLKP